MTAGGARVEALARALATVQPRRELPRIVAVLLSLWGSAPVIVSGDDAAAKRKRKRRRQKQRKKRRRRRRRAGCKLLPSGAECSDGAACCSGTCDENTAFPQFDAVCCVALGERCVIGRNECCLNFACHCTTPECVDFNGDAGECG